MAANDVTFKPRILYFPTKPGLKIDTFFDADEDKPDNWFLLLGNGLLMQDKVKSLTAYHVIYKTK